MNLVLGLLRILEIDRADLEKSKISLPILGGADLPFDCITTPQREPTDLRRGHIDIIRSSQVVGFR